MSSKPIDKTLDHLAGGRYVRLKSLIETGYIPFSPATLWRKVKDGSFPKPIKLSNQITAWRVEDLRNWALNPCEYRFDGTRRVK